MLALFTAIALALAFVERSLPPVLSFAPGAKLGLSNIAPLFAMIILTYGDAYLIMIVKSLFMAIFAGSPIAIVYSLIPGLLSLTVQVLLFRFFARKLSIISISVCGALTFNLFELVIAALIANQSVWLYLPMLVIAAVIAGTATGLIVFIVIKKVPLSVYGVRNGI